MSTADDVLAAAADADPEVRLAAAEHHLLDNRTITALASDPDDRVRSTVTSRVLTALTA